MEKLKRMLANPAAFVGLYIVFMIPTYLLPYLGSNSMAARAASALSGLGLLNIPFLLHLIAMLLLCLFCWIRGSHAGKAWLVVFPILAMVFDFVPGLNFIPLVPTVLHLLAIIMGVAGGRVAAVASS